MKRLVALVALCFLFAFQHAVPSYAAPAPAMTPQKLEELSNQLAAYQRDLAAFRQRYAQLADQVADPPPPAPGKFAPGARRADTSALAAQMRAENDNLARHEQAAANLQRELQQAKVQLEHTNFLSPSARSVNAGIGGALSNALGGFLTGGPLTMAMGGLLGGGGFGGGGQGVYGGGGQAALMQQQMQVQMQQNAQFAQMMQIQTQNFANLANAQNAARNAIMAMLNNAK